MPTHKEIRDEQLMGIVSCPRCSSNDINHHQTGFAAGHDERNWDHCRECHLDFNEEYDNSHTQGTICTVPPELRRETMYRVIVRTTGCLQPEGTFWNRDVLYCGDDRDEAARVFHTSEPSDKFRGYGGSCRETLIEWAEVTDGIVDMEWEPVEA